MGANAQVLFSQVEKGDNLVKMQFGVMSLNDNVAPVMLNTCVNFDEHSFNSVEVMAV